MPPCLYICCHWELSDEHPDPAARPQVPHKAQKHRRRSSQHGPKHHKDKRNSHHNHSRSNSHARSQANQPNTPTQEASSSRISASEIAPPELTHPHPHPNHQIVTLRRQLESEDLEHDKRITILRQQLKEELLRHSTKETTLRERLIDLSSRHRDRIRGQEAEGEEKSVAGGSKQESKKEGKKKKANESVVGRLGGRDIVKWIEGLKSVSSVTSSGLVSKQTRLTGPEGEGKRRAGVGSKTDDTASVGNDVHGD